MERGGSQQRRASLQGVSQVTWGGQRMRRATTANYQKEITRTCWRCVQSRLTRLHSNVHTTAAIVKLRQMRVRQKFQTARIAQQLSKW
jgi:hypothetical protein